MCESKVEGGMGFRDFVIFYEVLLINENLFFVKVLKVCYYLDCNFLEVLVGLKLSFIWMSIWSVKWIVEKGCRWLIGNGELVCIWKDRLFLREIIF